MKKIIAIVLFALMPLSVLASGGDAKHDPVKIDLSDKAALQRGARIFVNYCLSCHSAAYMRYNRMATDLGLNEKTMGKNMGFITNKKGEFKAGALMQATIPADVAEASFGTVPPDLSVILRSRSPSWFYTYMRSFYRDPKKPSGWNNITFPDVAMPHAMWRWQGVQRAIFRSENEDKHCKPTKSKPCKKKQAFDHFEVEQPGTMSEAEFNGAMRDLTTFMVYMGEPARLVRSGIGVMVILFLLVLLPFTYWLKKEYWKDLH